MISPKILRSYFSLIKVLFNSLQELSFSNHNKSEIWPNGWISSSSFDVAVGILMEVASDWLTWWEPPPYHLSTININHYLTPCSTYHLCCCCCHYNEGGEDFIWWIMIAFLSKWCQPSDEEQVRPSTSGLVRILIFLFPKCC